jgi:hypothetical protein
MNIFVIGDSADRGLVHLDILSHIAKDERSQRLYSLIQKVSLELDNALCDLIDGRLALMDTSDEPQGRPEFFLDIFSVSLKTGPAVGENASV